ncbi:MAG: FecR domain-containing protein [Alphaproteobacteria bacterium]|nr:FecR domain-containing protein [Alphaproteobacteria bacterium]
MAHTTWLSRGLWLAAFVGTLAGAAASPAQERIGAVRRLDPDGTREQPLEPPIVLDINSRLFSRDTIQTSTRGRVWMLFEDGSRLEVGPNSRVTLDDYVYKPGSAGARASLNFARGTMRFTSGKIERDGLQIRTPTATMGVRGTDFLVALQSDGATRVDVLTGTVLVWACDSPRLMTNAYVADAGYTLAVDANCVVSVSISAPGTGTPGAPAAVSSVSVADVAPAPGPAASPGGPGNGNGNGTNAAGGGNSTGSGPGTGNGGSNNGQSAAAGNGGGGTGNGGTGGTGSSGSSGSGGSGGGSGGAGGGGAGGAGGGGAGGAGGGGAGGAGGGGGGGGAGGGSGK